MLQLTPKSRSEIPEYARIQSEVAEEVGHINGKLGDIDWTPLRYINKTMSQSALAGLYRMARVGLVTLLRDGIIVAQQPYYAPPPRVVYAPQPYGYYQPAPVYAAPVFAQPDVSPALV